LKRDWLGSVYRPSSRPQAGSARRARPPGIEPLEARALLAVNVAVDSGAVAVNALSVLTGQIDPASDGGVSAADGITNIRQPTFRGTAAPFAVVQLLARPDGRGDLVSLGRTVTGSDGLWALTVGPLPDGVYALSADVVPPEGSPQEVIPVGPNGRLVIDTAGPRVVGLARGLRSPRITVSIRDDLSGLDGASLDNAANYTLLGPNPRRIAPAAVQRLDTAAVTATDPQLVSISTAADPRRLPALRGVRILSGGVRDVAGNPLDGESRGTLPSGNGVPGGHFIARFTSRRGFSASRFR
jgi:hypothetical protein